MTWSPLLDIRFYVVLALALAGLLALAHRLARGPSARGLGLILLRGLTLSILVLILLNPIRIERETASGTAADRGLPAGRVAEHEPGGADLAQPGCRTRDRARRLAHGS